MLAPRADALIAALAVTTLVTLVPLVLRLPAAGGRGRRVSARSALRQAAPIGLLALATVAYYRSGTIVLAAVAAASETAAFSVAASVAFALLMLPNAITTALLPRLALERDPVRLAVRARRAIGWTLAIALPLTAVAAAVVPFALPRLLGPEYARAGLPFVLLCVGIPLIAASGVIGTALLAAGHVRDLAVQVACSLLVNLVVLVLLAPPLGAIGASLATVACEIAGLLLLLRAASRALPGLVALRPLSPRRRVEAPGVVGL
jgi:O-antigen/teichoic acid export membrane protein